MDLAAGGERGEDVRGRSPGSRVRPKRDTRRGGRRGRARRGGGAGPGEPLRRARDADPLAQPPPELRLPAWSLRVAPRSRPRQDQQHPGGARRSGRRGRRCGERPANRRVSPAGAAGEVRGRGRRSQCSPRQLSTTSRSGQHRTLRGPGSVSAGHCRQRRPRPRRRGGRETGSRRWRRRRPASGALAPRRRDSRWTSQRSMPRVGHGDDLRGRGGRRAEPRSPRRASPRAGPPAPTGAR